MPFLSAIASYFSRPQEENPLKEKLTELNLEEYVERATSMKTQNRCITGKENNFDKKNDGEQDLMENNVKTILDHQTKEIEMNTASTLNGQDNNHSVLKISVSEDEGVIQKPALPKVDLEDKLPKVKSSLPVIVEAAKEVNDYSHQDAESDKLYSKMENGIKLTTVNDCRHDENVSNELKKKSSQPITYIEQNDQDSLLSHKDVDLAKKPDNFELEEVMQRSVNIDNKIKMTSPDRTETGVQDNVGKVENTSENDKVALITNECVDVPHNQNIADNMKREAGIASLPKSLMSEVPCVKVKSEQKSCTSMHLSITKEMMEEEERYKEEERKSLDAIREQAKAELKRTGKKQRYDRLQVLLNRSQMYATYLLGRIDARRKVEEQKAKRFEKTKKRVEKEHKHKDENDNTKIEVKKNAKRRGRKKRKVEETMNVEEYIDKSELEERVKKQKMDPAYMEEKNTPEEEKETLQDTFVRSLDGEKISDRQPLLITGGVMRNYQLDGMEWLRGLYEHGINGILADEMGLGKTIQSIALICSLIQQKVIGPFLIAAPLSTLPNWVSEFKKFSPEVHTVLYHGSIKERSVMRRKLMRIKKYNHGLASLPVVISSYEILMRDRVLLDQYNVEWKYLIVDEGHRIKNLHCKLIRELKLYKTSNRLLLTGTPLQNNLSELWSLLNFLLPDIFDDLSSFQSWFDFGALEDNEKFIAQEQEANVLNTLHSILTPFLLRRLKTDVDLSIPPKKEILVYAPLTEKQQDFYRTTLDRTIIDTLTKKNKPELPQALTPSGRPKRKTTNVIRYIETTGEDEEFDLDQLVNEMKELEKRRLESEAVMHEKEKKVSIVNIKLQNIMMQLRKCCNHPYLLEYPFNSDTQELIVDERLVKCSGKMLMLDRMLPELKRRGHKVLLFSQMTQMLDILMDYCSLRKYKFSRIDGTMNMQDRQQNIENFTTDDETFLFLLSTRSGGLGLNLMMADTCIIYDSDWVRDIIYDSDWVREFKIMLQRIC